MRLALLGRGGDEMSEYVFNTASNDLHNGGLHAATDLVTTLLETLAELDDRLGGAARAFKLPADPWDLQVTSDPTGKSVSLGEIVNGFYEAGQTRELATFFDALQCYAPSVELLEDTAIDAILRLSPSGSVEGFEKVYEPVCAAGYDAMQCVVTGGLLVSLAHERWDFDRAVVKCDAQRIEFDHASRPTHVDPIMLRKQKAAREAVTRQNFEAVRREAFPSLIWGRDVVRQIMTFPAEYLGLAFSRLASLDDIAKRWAGSGVLEPDAMGMELRNESQLTMSNYSEDRRFRSASGTMQTYETHVWVDRGNRIHLFLDRAAQTIEIGYLGPHLRTWTN